jgi:uncharacterized damage-inducible protein DinB
MEQRIISPLPAESEDLGRWLWALEDTRARTLKQVEGVSQEELDWTGPGVENAIGSLLYHIALIETDYLCDDFLGLDAYFPDLMSLFPEGDRDEAGRLSGMAGVPIEAHLARLATVRSRFIAEVSGFDRARLANARELPNYGYSISPEWTLHHLMQHEAEHRGQIGAIRSLFASRAIGFE